MYSFAEYPFRFWARKRCWWLDLYCEGLISSYYQDAIWERQRIISAQVTYLNCVILQVVKEPPEPLTRIII